jgi:hypothetical protein
MDFIKIRTKEFLGSINIIFSYIITDILKRPRSFKIGVFSIFLVVSFLTVLQAGLSITPLIFIKLAESQAGDIDLILTPATIQDDPRSMNAPSEDVIIRALNTSEITKKLEDIYEIRGIVPRWIIPIKVANDLDQNKSYQAIGLIIDSAKEEFIGVGRNLDAQVLKQDECWISENIGRLLSINGKTKID